MLLFIPIILAMRLQADESSDGKAIEAVIAALSDPPQPKPGVTISKEPWGEATFLLPDQFPSQILQLPRPRIVFRSIRFIESNGARAEAYFIREVFKQTETKSLVFELDRVGSEWKVVSMRIKGAINLPSPLP